VVAPMTPNQDRPIWGHRRGDLDYDVDWYWRYDPALLWWRIVHRLRGPARGCSCSRCFTHPKRRVNGSQIIERNVKISRLSQENFALRAEVHSLRRQAASKP
jgi:hypothetical protein